MNICHTVTYRQSTGQRLCITVLTQSGIRTKEALTGTFGFPLIKAWGNTGSKASIQFFITDDYLVLIITSIYYPLRFAYVTGQVTSLKLSKQPPCHNIEMWLDATVYGIPLYQSTRSRSSTRII